MVDFFRFPHTPHITWLAQGQPRDDKVLSMSQAQDLLHGDVVVEEKMDGANLGFSLSPEGELLIQNRGHYLHQPFTGQFARLPDWLVVHADLLVEVLFHYADNNLMLFGEWCAARHSLDYKSLPDWFLLFDVYERRTGRFWSSLRRNGLAHELSFATVPQLTQGKYGVPQLKDMLCSQTSQFRQGVLEGVVIRSESANWCKARAKLVRPDFTQTIDEHWSRRRIEWNQLHY